MRSLYEQGASVSVCETERATLSTCLWRSSARRNPDAACHEIIAPCVGIRRPRFQLTLSYRLQFLMRVLTVSSCHDVFFISRTFVGGSDCPCAAKALLRSGAIRSRRG